MTKTFVEILYPGSLFSESTVKVVENREPIELPEGAFAFRFFDQTISEVDGETLTGKPKNYSGKYYKGEVYTLEQLEEEFGGSGKHQILISNCRYNDWGRVVKTVRGNWQPLEENDVVL
jgi:hypothetical protein